MQKERNHKERVETRLSSRTKTLRNQRMTSRRATDGRNVEVLSPWSKLRAKRTNGLNLMAPTVRHGEVWNTVRMMNFTRTRVSTRYKKQGEEVGTFVMEKRMPTIGTNRYKKGAGEIHIPVGLTRKKSQQFAQAWMKKAVDKRSKRLGAPRSRGYRHEVVELNDVLEAQWMSATLAKQAKQSKDSKWTKSKGKRPGTMGSVGGQAKSGEAMKEQLKDRQELLKRAMANRANLKVSRAPQRKK